VRDPLWARRLSRRELLRLAGRGSAFLGASAFLSACGVAGQGRQSGPEDDASPEALPPSAGELVVASWPLYINQQQGDRSPTLIAFEEQTGISIQYKVVISANEEFFGTIREPLARGEPVGFDVIVVTDWLIEKMARLGFLRELDHTRLPNFENAFEKFVDPPFDPGNTHSIPWAAGITGIGYDISLTGRELTSVEDLFDPAFEGHVGMFREMRDTFGLMLLAQGVTPQDATVADIERAQRKLLDQRDEGIVRGYYGNDYTDQLATGSLWVSMAWSGDVFALQLDNPNLRFIIPEEGGMRWSDNMAIPATAEHPTDAHEWMNFAYTPRIAADITEWVWYESPVSQVPEIIVQDAAEAEGADRALLERIAGSPLVFPDEATVASTYNYKVLDEEEEAIWNELFQEVTQG